MSAPPSGYAPRRHGCLTKPTIGRAGVAIILFCCSVLAFQALDHKQSKPGIVTSPAESKNEEGHHSSAGLETVFDYCPDCGAGDIVPGRDGKCTNCGYALMEELVKNSE